MEIVFWLTDRFTAKHTPVIIEIQLSGFTNSYLLQYETDAKTPDGTLTYVDVIAGNLLDFDDNVVGSIGNEPTNPTDPNITPKPDAIMPPIMLLLDEDN